MFFMRWCWIGTRHGLLEHLYWLVKEQCASEWSASKKSIGEISPYMFESQSELDSDEEPAVHHNQWLQ